MEQLLSMQELVDWAEADQGNRRVILRLIPSLGCRWKVSLEQADYAGSTLSQVDFHASTLEEASAGALAKMGK